jgi:hypothetical protein
MLAARLLPPLLPSCAAALESSWRSSSISPVAIFAIITARPMASAGRFSPRGPLGILTVPVRVALLNENTNLLAKLGCWISGIFDKVCLLGYALLNIGRKVGPLLYDSRA